MGKIEAVRISTINESFVKPQYFWLLFAGNTPDNCIKDKLARKRIRLIK